MKAKYISIIVFSLLLSIGCSDSFLDTEQQGVVAVENFYKTDEEALQGILSVYDQFWTMVSGYSNYKQTLDLLSDDAYPGGSLRGDYFWGEELDEFRYGTNNLCFTFAWQQLYQGVYRANVILENVADDSEAKKIIRAEAKAWRAFFDFELVVGWGDVPLINKTLSPSEYAQPRTPKAEIWAQIEKDLSEAITDLPLKSQQANDSKGRFSKGTAQSLLGKAYLFQKKYAEAAAEFQKVIDSGEYDLYPDFSKITRRDSEFGVESIFEVSQPDNASNVNPNEAAALNALFWMPKGAGWFDPSPQLMIANFGFNIMTARLSLWQAYKDAGDSVRRVNTVLSESEVIAMGANLRNPAITTPDLPQGTLAYGTDSVLRVKYATWVAESSTGFQNYPVNFGVNIRWMRYADVLLMAAEAYNRQPSPDDAKAREYINQVRQRAQLPDLDLSGDALFDAIKLERRLELAFENHRFQDLIRWGDAAIVLKDKGKKTPKGDGTYVEVPEAGFKDPKSWLFPIPESELNVNPKITENNPGY
jgi:starch-binding outer membrane protein, SusD/RagB family